MKLGKIVSNNGFLLRQIAAASPGRIPFQLAVVIIKSVSNFMFDVYMIRFVVNGIQTGEAFSRILIFILSIAAYHLCVCFIENYFNEKYAPVSDQKIYRHIQKKLFKKAAEVELACFENPDFYDRYVKAVSEASGRASQTLDALSSIVRCVFTVTAVSLVIFTIDPFLIVFAVVPLVANLIFGKRLNKVRHTYNMEMQEKSRKRDYVRRAYYLADYAKEMRLSNINKALFVKFADSIEELKAVIRKHGFKIGMFNYILEATNDIIVYLGAILYASYQTLITRNMLFGDCIVVINSINSVAYSLRGLVDTYLEFDDNALYIDNLKFFLEYEPAIHANPDGLAPPNVCRFALRDMSFKYDGQEGYALKNISFEVNPGEKIAIVGHNGAGKTTLTKLLMRLYDPTEGEILLDGVNIRQYKLREYRELFGTAFQDCRVFSLSVTENIILKDSITEADRQLALASMKHSGIYEKIQSLPKQENTILTREFADDGAVLSGGEYQKVAIARVFAKPCEIVILDEPSSALDPIAEYQMYEAMMQVCKDKSVVFISHRLSSAVLADRVYLLENGEIAEQGSHFELLQQNGRYAEMWEMQAEKYVSQEAAV